MTEKKSLLAFITGAMSVLVLTGFSPLFLIAPTGGPLTLETAFNAQSHTLQTTSAPHPKQSVAILVQHDQLPQPAPVVQPAEPPSPPSPSSPAPQPKYNQKTPLPYMAQVGDNLFCRHFLAQTPDGWPAPASAVIKHSEPQLLGPGTIEQQYKVVAYQPATDMHNLWHTLPQVMGSIISSIGSDVLQQDNAGKFWMDGMWGFPPAFQYLWDKLKPYQLDAQKKTYADFCFIGPSEKCRMFPFTDRTGASTPYCDQEYRFLRKVLGAECLKPRAHTNRVVVISRRKTRGRGRDVVNWDETIKTISSVFSQVEVATLEDHDMCTQIGIISSADIVFALRGAGEGLIPFMSDKAVFISVYHEKEYWFPVPARLEHLNIVQLIPEDPVYCPGTTTVCEVHNNWADWRLNLTTLNTALLKAKELAT